VYANQLAEKLNLSKTPSFPQLGILLDNFLNKTYTFFDIEMYI